MAKPRDIGSQWPDSLNRLLRSGGRIGSLCSVERDAGFEQGCEQICAGRLLILGSSMIAPQ